MVEFSVRTGSRTEMVDITDRVQRAVAQSGVKSGLCLVHAPHTTAAVTVNENADPDVQRDILSELNKIVPFEDGYRHSEGNSAAHLKASLVGPSVTLPVEEGRVRLGRWQGIYFSEFDGPRDRSVWVQVR